MKKTIVFILAFSFATTPLLSQMLFAKKGDVLNIFAVSGLNLRAEPSITGKVITKIPYAEKVTVIEPSEYNDPIEDRQGIWLKVQYKSQSGYLFSGYLTKLAVPKIDTAQITCYEFYEFPNWIKKTLKNDTLVSSGKRLFKRYDPDGKDWNSVNWEFYSSGTMVYHYFGYESETYVIESFDITLNDILNFLNYYAALHHSKCDNKLTIKLNKTGSYDYFDKIECSDPRPFTATRLSGKTIIEISLWDL